MDTCNPSSCREIRFENASVTESLYIYCFVKRCIKTNKVQDARCSLYLNLGPELQETSVNYLAIPIRATQAALPY